MHLTLFHGVSVCEQPAYGTEGDEEEYMKCLLASEKHYEGMHAVYNVLCVFKSSYPWKILHRI